MESEVVFKFGDFSVPSVVKYLPILKRRRIKHVYWLLVALVTPLKNGQVDYKSLKNSLNFI